MTVKQAIRFMSKRKIPRSSYILDQEDIAGHLKKEIYAEWDSIPRIRLVIEDEVWVYDNKSFGVERIFVIQKCRIEKGFGRTFYRFGCYSKNITGRKWNWNNNISNLITPESFFILIKRAKAIFGEKNV